MKQQERRSLELQAYHDGELPVWRRLRVERRLARDPEARRELGTLEEVGTLMREVAAEAAGPDLWPGIEARLAVTPAPTVAGAKDETPGHGWRWGVGVAAAAAAALVLTWFVAAGPGPTAAPGAGSVEWLDAGGEATMILQDDDEATIIWVISKAVPPAAVPGGPAHAAWTDGRAPDARV